MNGLTVGGVLEWLAGLYFFGCGGPNVDGCAWLDMEYGVFENGAKYHRLFEEDLTGDFVATPEGRLVECNRAFAAMYGLGSPEEAVGTDVASFRTEGWPILVEKVKRDRKVIGHASWHVRPDGGRLHIVANVVGQFDAAGELVAIQGCVFDDTERTLGRDALREANERLEMQTERLAEANVELLRQREELEARALELEELKNRAVVAVREARKELWERERAERELQELTESLEVQVAERTAALQVRSEQLARLTLELSKAEQRERGRLAQVLHDGLQQLLVAAKMSLDVLGRRLGEGDRALVERVAGMLDESVAASRSLTAELSPPVLREGSLAESLEWLARWMQEKHGLSVEVRVDPGAGTSWDELKLVLFQSVRELLFNVVKHAGVLEAMVVLEVCGDRLCLRVSDQGAGFDRRAMWEREGRTTGGFGLLSIRERLLLLGGHLEVESWPGRGSRFTLCVPREAPVGS